MARLSIRSRHSGMTAIAVLAVIAATVGAGAALAHDPPNNIEGTRMPTVNPVYHLAVPDGEWTFTVQAVTGTVKNLSLIVKSPGCPGTTLLEYRIRRPTEQTYGAFTLDADADAGNSAADYCSMVFWQGSGSAEVVVAHP